MTQAIPTYAELEDLSRRAGHLFDPAEYHGVFAALSSDPDVDPVSLCETELLGASEPGDLLAKECRESWSLLARSWRGEGGPEFTLELFLPEDDDGLRRRAAALREWVRGFLFGLGLLGVTEKMLSRESAEALADLTEVSRLNAELAHGEEDEQNLTELVEFTRVAAAMIQTDLRRKSDFEPQRV